MIEPDIIYLFYDPEYNIFVDEDAFIVPNMLEYVTANDLFLFRRGKQDATFRHVGRRDAICKIYWMYDHDEYFDIGDDYERITRYEKGKRSWIDLTRGMRCY